MKKESFYLSSSFRVSRQIPLTRLPLRLSFSVKRPLLPFGAQSSINARAALKRTGCCRHADIESWNLRRIEKNRSGNLGAKSQKELLSPGVGLTFSSASSGAAAGRRSPELQHHLAFTELCEIIKDRVIQIVSFVALPPAVKESLVSVNRVGMIFPSQLLSAMHMGSSAWRARPKIFGMEAPGRGRWAGPTARWRDPCLSATTSSKIHAGTLLDHESTPEFSALKRVGSR